MSLALYGAHSGVINDLLATQSLFNRAIVDETSLLAPTLTTGTPAAGVFYSSIPGRASIPDISRDLKVDFGVERIATQQIYQLQNEFGPNGEPVWGAIGDDRGLVRFVGNWFNLNDSNGIAGNTSSSTPDYVEITFYGTGLNILVQIYSNASLDLRASVDGGSEGSNLWVSSSSPLTGRNYSSNQVIAVASSLSLGVHTVRIRQAVAGTGYRLYGFEVLNTSSTTSLTVNPGSAYLNGVKKTLASQSTSLLVKPASLTGTRGGRVVTYLGADNVLGQAVRAVDASPLYMNNANHANEEIARTYYFREFGAGRSDDFSLLGASSNRAFTLDDGTTTLIGSSVVSAVVNSIDQVGFGAINSFLSLTFVGTGVDIFATSSGGFSGNFNISVDGAAVGSITSVSAGNRVIKLASGLPYGTHTVRITYTSGISGNFQIANFIVYQPKKPSIPSGAVELADYNVMADFVANSTAGTDTIATGILRKSCMREFVYVGTWAVTLAPASSTTGFYIGGSTAGNYFQYTFFGTGFDMRLGIPSVTAGNYTMTINGLAPSTANFPASSTGFYGGVTGFTASTGVVTTNTSGTAGSGVRVSGLPLGVHTVRLSYNSGSFMGPEAIDIITPIHSHLDKTICFQNTLPTGSCSMKDLRQTKVLPDKAVAQASGVTGSSATTATGGIPVPDLSVTVKTSGNPIEIFYSAIAFPATASAFYTQVYVNGSPVGVLKNPYLTTPNREALSSDRIILYASAGIYKIDLYFYTNVGTITVNQRSMNVREL